METKLKCRNCGTNNPFYQLTCSNCSAYLREKIFNIDLWSILPQLIESPAEAYSKIIHAEHKNFTIFFLFLAAIKLGITSIFISLAAAGNNHYMQSAISVFLVSAGILVVTILLTALSFTKILKQEGTSTRIRDNISVLIFSLVPYAAALIILFPIELIVFGYNVFSVNPSPFHIKSAIAYIMLSFEILIIVWAVFLSFVAFRKQSGGYTIPVVFTIIFNGIVYGLLTLAALFIYVI